MITEQLIEIRQRREGALKMAASFTHLQSMEDYFYGEARRAESEFFETYGVDYE